MHQYWEWGGWAFAGITWLLSEAYQWPIPIPWVNDRHSKRDAPIWWHGASCSLVWKAAPRTFMVWDHCFLTSKKSAQFSDVFFVEQTTLGVFHGFSMGFPWVFHVTAWVLRWSTPTSWCTSIDRKAVPGAEKFRGVLWWDPQMLRTYTLVNLQKTMERSTMLWKWVNDIYFDWAMFTSKLFVDQRVAFMERLSHGSKSSSSDDNSENYDMVVSPNENWTMTIRLIIHDYWKPWWLVDTGLGNFSHLGRLCCRARGLGSSIPISGFSPFLSIKTSIYCNKIHFLIQVYTQHQFFHRFILKSSNFAADSSCFLPRTSYKSPRRCLDRGISHPKLVI